MKGTFTGKLGTINKDGSSHITPIWYILDENNYITFTTYSKSVKAKNLLRDSRISICVDDQTPPFSFVISQWKSQRYSLNPRIFLYGLRKLQKGTWEKNYL